MSNPTISEAHQIKIYTLMFDDEEIHVTVVNREAMPGLSIPNTLHQKQVSLNGDGYALLDENNNLIYLPPRYAKEEIEEHVFAQFRKQGIIQ
jgi:hypothetical protein